MNLPETSVCPTTLEYVVFIWLLCKITELNVRIAVSMFQFIRVQPYLPITDHHSSSSRSKQMFPSSFHSEAVNNIWFLEAYGAWSTSENLVDRNRHLEQLKKSSTVFGSLVMKGGHQLWDWYDLVWIWYTTNIVWICSQVLRSFWMLRILYEFGSATHGVCVPLDIARQLL